MINKIEELIKDYEKKLKIKENRIKVYVELKNTIDGFKYSPVSELEYNKLYYEIQLIKTIISDLKWSLQE